MLPIASGNLLLAPNEMWSMDFVSDELFDGRRLRASTVVDALTRESLAIDVGQGIKGEQVVQAMAPIAVTRGTPRTIRVDNVVCRKQRERSFEVTLRRIVIAWSLRRDIDCAG